MVTFRQSPSWYYPWPDAAVSTSVDTQHLWAWWHFGNHLVDIIPGQMQLSQHPPIQSTRGHGDISVITYLILSLARCSCLNIRGYKAPVGMVTFRQSPCWYYPWPDAAVSTSVDTKHLWAWWHFGNHLVDIIPGQMQLSQHPWIQSTCGHGDISAITLLILSLARCSCLNIRRYTAPVGIVTFRQSPSWYYPWPDAAVSTSADTQHPWAWWHFGNHLVDIIPGQMQLSQHPSIHSTRGHGDISVITLLILSLARCSCLNIRGYKAPVGMVTFRQSPCWYYPWPDAAVSTSVDTQHPWA